MLLKWLCCLLVNKIVSDRSYFSNGASKSELQIQRHLFQLTLVLKINSKITQF